MKQNSGNKAAFIIGGGFGGIAAARRLCLSNCRLDVAIIDKKGTSDFLPMLPDCIGRGIDPQCLTYKIEDAAKDRGFKFINEEVMSVNLEKKEVLAKEKAFNYDFLVIASGTETNFYSNDNIRKNAYKLDSAEDVEIINRELRQNRFKTYIVCGGGYTGIEAVANLRVFLNKNKRNGRLIVVERAGSILGPLPEWMKSYVSDNLKNLEIEVLLNTQIEKIDGKNVYVSGGRAFDDALVIWAAGVKTADFIQNLRVSKNQQGRIIVDEYLRLDEYCFVIGDASNFLHRDVSLRMAVQFAITQGECAAKNILNSVKGRPLNKYIPVDLGYIIPMANNRSCGNVLGLNLKGFLPTLLHFIMCIYRSYGIRNKLGIIKRLI